MFNTICKAICFSIFILILSGCFGGYSGEPDLDVSEIVFLDDAGEVGIEVEKGDIFGLDMPSPLGRGYATAGAAFDPGRFRMERYIEYDDDGPRVRYLFTAIEAGTSEVSLKVRPVAGGEEEVHRTVRVVVDGE